MEHPSDETLKRFVKGKAPREEGRAVVAHLLKGCQLCAERIKTLLEPHPVAGGAHEAVLNRFESRLASKLEELEEAPPSRPTGPVRQPSSPPDPPPKGRGKDR